MPSHMHILRIGTLIHSHRWMCVDVWLCMGACVCTLAGSFGSLFIWPNDVCVFSTILKAEKKKRKNVRPITANSMRTHRQSRNLAEMVKHIWAAAVAAADSFPIPHFFLRFIYCFLYRCSCYFWVDFISICNMCRMEQSNNSSSSSRIVRETWWRFCWHRHMAYCENAAENEH